MPYYDIMTPQVRLATKQQTLVLRWFGVNAEMLTCRLPNIFHLQLLVARPKQKQQTLINSCRSDRVK